MLYVPSLKNRACTNLAAIHYIIRTGVRQVTLGIRATSDYSTINRNNVKRALRMRCKQRIRDAGTNIFDVPRPT